MFINYPPFFGSSYLAGIPRYGPISAPVDDRRLIQAGKSATVALLAVVRFPQGLLPFGMKCGPDQQDMSIRNPRVLNAPLDCLVNIEWLVRIPQPSTRYAHV